MCARYDNLIRPRRGFRYALDLRGTHKALGSTTQLLQLIGEAGHILPLPWRLSLATSGRAGITFLSDPLDEIPPSLRFFAGGDQSVRGYAYQSLGPKDMLGNVVGGKHLLTGSVALLASAPFWEISTARSPLAAPSGTWQFIWYRPEVPGVRPAKAMLAATPPMVTWG